MLGFRFHDPWWLLLLVPLAGIVYASFGRRRPAAVLFSDVSVLKLLPRTMAGRFKRFLPWMLYGSVALLVVAMARPQQGREDFRIRTQGIAIEMCIDRSGSMEAMDFELDGRRATRLDAVKRVFDDFVTGNGDLPGRPDDLIGLVAFGGYVDAKCPLTLDHAVLSEMLHAVIIPQPIFDSQGRVINATLLDEETRTAIGDAVIMGVDRLKDVPAKSKIIILLSDGVCNAGVADPAAAIEAAKAYGIKIYTIGVGSNGMAPFPEIDPLGRRVLVNQPVEFDEATMRKMAEATGGKYFNAQDTEALENVYAEIDQLEKTSTEGRLYTEYLDLYRWFLLPGLCLILTRVALVSTRFRTLP
ncbi:MAG TPA: VWA domain-containing protein [Thermoguttaceae bacterium]|nr:VWA domain-containing protein [Thermoguttaceae bacterium]